MERTSGVMDKEGWRERRQEKRVGKLVIKRELKKGGRKKRAKSE